MSDFDDIRALLDSLDKLIKQDKVPTYMQVRVDKARRCLNNIAINEDRRRPRRIRWSDDRNGY